jgi:hypothetical protein
MGMGSLDRYPNNFANRATNVQLHRFLQMRAPRSFRLVSPENADD